MIEIKNYDFFHVRKKVISALRNYFNETNWIKDKNVKNYEIIFNINKEKKIIEIYYLPNDAIVFDSFESVFIPYKKIS